MTRVSKSEQQHSQAGGHKPVRGHLDGRVAVIFQDMRKVSGLTPGQLAKQLGTPLGTIAAFEKGAIGALPEWPETSRIIKAYASLVQIDPGPLLRHVALQLSPAPVKTIANVAKTEPAKTSAGSGKSRRRRRWPRMLIWLSVLLCIAAGLGAAGFYASQNPQIVKSVFSSLPEPVVRTARSIRALFAQIDVGGAAVDPGDSRTDKLPGEAITVPPPR
jgi:cytoskeletal protein RodZ